MKRYQPWLASDKRRHRPKIDPQKRQFPPGHKILSSDGRVYEVAPDGSYRRLSPERVAEIVARARLQEALGKPVSGGE